MSWVFSPASAQTGVGIRTTGATKARLASSLLRGRHRRPGPAEARPERLRFARRGLEPGAMGTGGVMVRVCLFGKVYFSGEMVEWISWYDLRSRDHKPNSCGHHFHEPGRKKKPKKDVWMSFYFFVFHLSTDMLKHIHHKTLPSSRPPADLGLLASHGRPGGAPFRALGRGAEGGAEAQLSCLCGLVERREV